MDTSIILEVWTVCAVFGTLSTYWLIENINNLERVTPFKDTNEDNEFREIWENKQSLIERFHFYKQEYSFLLLGLLFVANYLLFLLSITAFVGIHLGFENYKLKK